MLQSPSAHFNGKMTVNELRGQNHSEAPIVDPQEKSGVTNKGGTGLALYDDTAKPELFLFYLPWRRWRGTHTRLRARTPNYSFSNPCAIGIKEGSEEEINTDLIVPSCFFQRFIKNDHLPRGSLLHSQFLSNSLYFLPKD